MKNLSFCTCLYIFQVVFLIGYLLSLHQWLTHATGRSVSGCVCSVPAAQCVPALTNMLQTTAHVWRDRPQPSHHSVSLCTDVHVEITVQECKNCIPCITLTSFKWVAYISTCRILTIALFCNSLSTAPPSGPCDIQCQNGGSCFLNARQVAKCRCQPSYTGERCEINQCRDYCKNGGTCTASHTGKSRTHLPRRPWFSCPEVSFLFVITCTWIQKVNDICNDFITPMKAGSPWSNWRLSILLWEV